MLCGINKNGILKHKKTSDERKLRQRFISPYLFYYLAAANFSATLSHATTFQNAEM